MQDITQILTKANKQLEELNKTVSSLEGEKLNFTEVKMRVLDFKDKLSSVKHSLEYKKGGLMTILFDIVFRIYGRKSYDIGARPSRKNVTLTVGAWKHFEIIGGRHNTILLAHVGNEEHCEFFTLMWEAMLEDIRRYLTGGPSDVSKRIQELDTLKKQLEALPLICPQVVIPS